MRFLYAVFVVSIAALVLAALAIARTVRRHKAAEQDKSLSLKSKPVEPETNETTDEVE